MRPGITPHDTIPSQVVAPILRDVLKDYGLIMTDGGDKGWHTEGGGNGASGYYNAADLVATQYGGKTNTWYMGLRRIMSGEQLSASIPFVDHFLVALGAHHLWYMPPLSDYYFSEAILSMPDEDCGEDLMFFKCCDRWGSSQQKVPGTSRQCKSCRRKYDVNYRKKAA